SYKQYQSQMKKYINNANDDYQQIRELLNLSANDSVAGGYIRNANTEGRMSNIWRGSTVFFIILAAIWLFYSFISGQGTVS
ncbi:hypothetical protein R0J87_23430, partial [Halomonas sp. SIMBA_159]